ncbi:hypothetical protein C7S16_6065 [Burkholderia thailandensis]|uniref:Uncharacterized protein n=1 Tax=Burkholderia thailandensis TaxID=57975 RepID=A0AAW9CSL5_BURTH|nr:hypothetical protein [Burkholderia thailandensis]
MRRTELLRRTPEDSPPAARAGRAKAARRDRASRGASGVTVRSRIGESDK